MGETVRLLRVKRKLTLRELAEHLQISSSNLGKMERGVLKFDRKHATILAKYFSESENKFISLWKSDNSTDKDHAIANSSQQMNEPEAHYTKSKRSGLFQSKLLKTIQEVLQKDGRVASAWLFGSVARNEQNKTSDVDIMVELNKMKNYSLFDLMDISHAIETKIKRKVDLVERGYLRDFASKTAKKNWLKIYG